MKNNPKQTALGCVVLLGLLFVCAVRATLAGRPSQPAKIDPSAPVQARVTIRAKEILKDNLVQVEMIAPVAARIDYSLEPVFGDGDLVLRAATNLQKLAPEAFALDGIEVLDLRAITEFRDIYGNSTRRPSVRFVVNRETAAKVNWPNVNVRNLGRILGTGVEVHPALRSAWAEFEAGR